MSMNFIDISSYQRGLDLNDLFAKNPALNGVVVKATGGTTYVQDTCDPWIQQLIKMKKPWGFYHFLNDDNKNAGAEKEAEFFVKACKNYFGVGVPFVDYEGAGLKLGTTYLKTFMDKVFALTGVKMVVYCSISVLHSQDFKAIAGAGYGLWIAQYANNKFTGFQDDPWQSGSVAPFPFYMMHQYSSSGRLTGYSGNLDLDKFYGDSVAWGKYAAKQANAAPAPAAKSIDDLAREVIAGKWGNGAARKSALTKAGYDYSKVQDRVNEILNGNKISDITKIAKEVIQGKWGNGAARKSALTKAGYDYNAVQAKVNELLK